MTAVISLTIGFIGSITGIIGNFLLKRYSWALDKKRFFEEISHKEKLGLCSNLANTLSNLNFFLDIKYYLHN